MRRNFSESSEIQRYFPPKLRWSPKKKKRRSSPKLSLIFRPKSEIQTFFPPKLRWSPKKKVFTEIESDFSAEIGNSNVFSAQNQVVSKKKKKVFTEIESDFSAQIGNSNVFSAQNQVVSKKKKRSSPKLSLIFRPKSEIQTFEGGLFSYGGGLFSILHKKSASKPPKTCDFAYFTSQWGGLEPPRPPWLRY